MIIIKNNHYKVGYTRTGAIGLDQGRSWIYISRLCQTEQGLNGPRVDNDFFLAVLYNPMGIVSDGESSDFSIPTSAGFEWSHNIVLIPRFAAQ